MTVRSQRSRLVKRFALPAALVVMGGMGVTLALPASADTEVVKTGEGATPEEATRHAESQCHQEGLQSGSIRAQNPKPDGGFETVMVCFRSVNDIPAGRTTTGTGPTPEFAEFIARQECINIQGVPGNQVGMEEDDRHQPLGRHFTATIECNIPAG